MDVTKNKFRRYFGGGESVGGKEVEGEGSDLLEDEGVEDGGGRGKNKKSGERFGCVPRSLLRR